MLHRSLVLRPAPLPAFRRDQNAPSAAMASSERTGPYTVGTYFTHVVAEDDPESDSNSKTPHPRPYLEEDPSPIKVSGGSIIHQGAQEGSAHPPKMASFSISNRAQRGHTGPYKYSPAHPPQRTIASTHARSHTFIPCR